jgi:type IV secretion system protein VirD4
VSVRPAVRREGPLDQLLLIGILVLLAFTVLLWLTGEVGAYLHAGVWPRVTLADMGTVLVRIVRRPGNPAAAWPPVARKSLPGPVLFWGIFVVLTVIAVALWLWLQTLLASLRRRVGRVTVVQRPAPAPDRAGPGGWARPQLFRELYVRDHAPWRVTLGRLNGRLVAAEALQPVIAVGPTQSLKSAGLTIPAVLEWDGPVLACSIKPELVQRTLSRRWQKGEVFLFDPTGVTNLEANGWSPLPRCERWEGAYRTALGLVGAGRPREGAAGHAPTLLAALLLAAANSGRTMADVLRWAQRHDTAEVTAALAVAGEPAAGDAFESIGALDGAARTQAYTAVTEVLGAYADPAFGHASAVAGDLSAERLLDGPANTAYVVVPAHEQRRLGPLAVALVQDVIDLAFQRSRNRGAPLDPALLVVLDDAASSAPLPQLDVYAATAAGYGVQLVSTFRHVGQMQARYGERGEEVLASHRAKVILSGIVDQATLGVLSHLLEDETIRHLAAPAALAKAGRDQEPEPARTRHTSPAEALRWVAPGQGVLLYGHLPPAYLTLRPWFRDRRLTAMVAPTEGAERSGR